MIWTLRFGSGYAGLGERMNQNRHGYHIGFRNLLILALMGLGLTGYGQNDASPSVPETQTNRAPSPREPEGVISLQSAMEWALMQSPELMGSAYGVQAAEGAAQQAGALANPTFELTAEEFGGSGARKGTDAAQTTALLNQTLDWGGKRGKRRDVAQAEARLVGWDYEAKRLDILISTKKAYVDLLLAQGQLSLSQSLLVLAEDVRLAAAKRVQSGKVPPLEETKAGVEVASARIARDRAQRELDTARRRLASKWGATLPLFREAGGELDSVQEVPSLERLSATLDHTPEVARWNDEVAFSRKSLAVAKSERSSDVSLNAGISRFEQDGSHAFTAGVSVPLPLFNRNAGGILAASHRATRVDYEQRAARLRAVTDLVEAHNRLAMARTEAVTTKRELLPGAQQAFEAAKTGYQEGKWGYLEMLDAQRTWSEAKSRYLDVLAAYHKAAADVERLAGTPVPTIK
jgi:cobalt-zinc-cadmium efflux system outer membrane protein